MISSKPSLIVWSWLLYKTFRGEIWRRMWGWPWYSFSTLQTQEVYRDPPVSKKKGLEALASRATNPHACVPSLSHPGKILHMSISRNDISEKVVCSFSLPFLEQCRKDRRPSSFWSWRSPMLHQRPYSLIEENSKAHIKFSADRIIRAGGAAGVNSWICVLGFLIGHKPGTGLVAEDSAWKRKVWGSHMYMQSLPSLWHCQSRVCEAQYPSHAWPYSHTFLSHHIVSELVSPLKYPFHLFSSRDDCTEDWLGRNQYELTMMN